MPEFKARPILLTGSSGWLGRFLAPLLKLEGYEVVGMDVAPGAYTDIVASVADAAAVKRVFAERAIGAVIHAGGLHKPDIKRFPAQSFIDVNVAGTLNLLSAAAAAGHDRFIFTSTTSLMITAAIRKEEQSAAVWLDENFAPLAPRNIYGVTKLAAENLCRVWSADHKMACIVLRTARFFPEDDDALHGRDEENTKANEFLNRRLTVEDAARAHIVALEKAPEIGFGVYIVSAPTPFAPGDAAALRRDAVSVIARLFPDAPALYAARGWALPATIARVYDASKMTRDLGFTCKTDFAAILAALRDGEPLPFAHQSGYVSPVINAAVPLAAS